MERKDIMRFSVTERLRDGRSVTIRVVSPNDKGRLADAIREVSHESFYRRTFATKRDLSDQELKQLAEVDFERVVALVAVMHDNEGEKIVGGGRYVRSESPGAASTAEVAFLVDDAYQSLGIGSRIFRNLVAIARAAGITQFEAEVLPSNEAMLRLFMRSGLPLIKTPSRESIHVSIMLSDAATMGEPWRD
jgi:RimJ/RimL family protein N-acetyltransferase